MDCVTTKLHAVVKDFSPRGGATIVEVRRLFLTSLAPSMCAPWLTFPPSFSQINGSIMVFGGADREQTHFQDLLMYKNGANSQFQAATATGDIPMPRSGHAVVAFGKYMLLYGGIDFAEEAVFNDLYILDTDSLEWGYVGESGAEVLARNSHSMGIVYSSAGAGAVAYLVVYGGASPEHGALGDTLYAQLPDPASIDDKFFIKWEVLETGVLASPGSREMHGSCCFQGRLFISGGRDGDGNLLED
ncbi:hypothetical protein B484DRAFT_483367, partial [Ochromonadaceae sp. CCMP2298]